MKTNTLLYTFLLLSSTLSAQLFEVAPGHISNTSSDSRSVNFLDLNNDGWEDIYISNGLEGGQKDFLYLNDGTGQFTQITNMEIVTAENPSDGASFADFNNDGHVDAIVSSWYGAEDLLYLNDGAGNLNYNTGAGIISGSFAETALFGDYNGDGWLDIYVTNSGGNLKNYLYRNLQNNKFNRITVHPLVDAAKASRAAIWVDVNNDMRPDLFVANEGNATNDLYISQEDGSYTPLTEGTIVTTVISSITASWGDIDNDGDMDCFVGNSGYFAQVRNQLFRNNGNLNFEEIMTGPVVTGLSCTFGSAFGDYDNDGDLDLIIANGFCNGGLANVLYENQGDGTFVEASSQLVSNGNTCSFGIAWGDVNNDGFLDLMVANCKNAPVGVQPANKLLLNQGNDNNWLQVKLIGNPSNTNAIGAKVRIKATIDGVPVWQIREIQSQTGYAGQNSLVAHFGLGDAENVDSLVVNWPSGNVQTLENVSINQKLVVDESVISSTRDLASESSLNFLISPNPSSLDSSELLLRIDNKSATADTYLRIHDAKGQKVWEEKLRIQKGITQHTISSAQLSLARGMYQVSLQLGGRTMTQTLVIQ